MKTYFEIKKCPIFEPILPRKLQKKEKSSDFVQFRAKIVNFQGLALMVGSYRNRSLQKCAGYVCGENIGTHVRFHVACAHFSEVFARFS